MFRGLWKHQNSQACSENVSLQSVKVGHYTEEEVRAQELCESRGDRPRPPVPDNPYGFRGRKAA